MSAWARLTGWARALRRDGLTLWFALRDPRTGWWVRALAVVVVAYALSPVDLIPDVIPVLGLLDELVLLPVLVWLALRGLTPQVRADCRARAEQWQAEGRARPVSRVGAAIVIGLWCAAAATLAAWLWPS
ncbi:MAG: DUF1232 domain-containing protein [Rubrivivax sp.]|nr:DUF1232 domain-containing protein [Rubrivivax sp.]